MTVFTLLVSALSTVLVIFVLRDVARRFGLTDQPTARKSHKGEIPLIGGIAIYLAFAIAMIYAGLLVELRYFLLAGGLLIVVGAIDDVRELTPKVRLVMHVASALIMALLGGVVVTDLGEIFVPGSPVTLGWFAVPFTVFAVVALLNAVNMSDGLDGHCGMQTLIPMAGLALLAGVSGDTAHFLPVVALCGCLAGFLVFNLRTPWRSRASIFLGDAGSGFLGFALAWFLIDMSQGPGALITPVTVLWFSLLVIYSTVEIVCRRVLRRRSPFEPDREHLHHVFLLAGFSVSETVAVLGTITLVGVFVGLASNFYSLPQNVMFATFVLFGLLFLRLILRTWKVMRFLHRSICRRRGDRRANQGEAWSGPDRRTGVDRRTRRVRASD